MSIEQAQLIIDVLIRAMAGTARAAIIGMTLLAIGSPLSLAFSAKFGRLTAPFAAVCGLFILTVASWYAFRFGVRVEPVYLALVILGIGVSSIAFARRAGVMGFRTAMRKGLPSVIAVAVTFVIPVFIVSILSFAKVRSNGLQMLSTGNNDIFAYLKLGGTLLALPGAETMAAGGDITPSLTLDVFGAMNLVPLTSFILHIPVEKCAAPVLGFAIGLISLGIITICRRIFALPYWAGILIAVLFMTGQLFTYLILNYFLAQLLFEGVLLATAYYLAEIADNREGAIAAASMAMIVGSVCVMFTYHPWFVQYTVLAAAGVGGALLMNGEALTVRKVAAAAAISAVILIAINAFDFAIGLSRYLTSVENLVNAAGKVEAGWPLPFVNLSLLMGIPARWQLYADDGTVSALQIVPGIAIAVAALAFCWMIDKAPGNRPRRFLLLTFFATMILYFVAWGVYGESYRQWKFATTLPLPLGFVIAACVFLALKRFGMMGKIAIGIVLLLIIAGNIVYFSRSSPPALVFDHGLEQIAGADTDSSVKAVYIDISGYSQRMAAAIFINHKPIYFSGPTYYGPETKPQDLPEGTIAILRETCTSREEAPDYEVVKLPASQIQAGKARCGLAYLSNHSSE